MEDALPLQLRADVNLERKKVATRNVFRRIEGNLYDFKTVHKAVEKRLSQQKYAIEHYRAVKFLEHNPSIIDSLIVARVESMYTRNNWRQTDTKKVT